MQIKNGLMNFVYSFITKPKHIFLVHGEEESQEVLRDKIYRKIQELELQYLNMVKHIELDDKLRIVNKIKIQKTLTV